MKLRPRNSFELRIWPRSGPGLSHSGAAQRLRPIFATTSDIDPYQLLCRWWPRLVAPVFACLRRHKRQKCLRATGGTALFAAIPLIRAEVRNAFRRHYPEAAYWGATNTTQHAAFQCLWLQYDHVVPHARGGDESTGNLVPTCAGCNYGRVSMTLEEVGLLDPRLQPIRVSDWDGLERILTPRCSQPASSG